MLSTSAWALSNKILQQKQQSGNRKSYKPELRVRWAATKYRAGYQKALRTGLRFTDDVQLPQAVQPEREATWLYQSLMRGG